MKTYFAGLLGMLLLFVGSMVPNVRAQAAVEAHLAAAKAAAGEDYARMFENLCSVPEPGGESTARPYPPPSSEWDAEPAKVLDNLY